MPVPPVCECKGMASGGHDAWRVRSFDVARFWASEFSKTLASMSAAKTLTRCVYQRMVLLGRGRVYHECARRPIYRETLYPASQPAAITIAPCVHPPARRLRPLPPPPSRSCRSVCGRPRALSVWHCTSALTWLVVAWQRGACVLPLRRPAVRRRIRARRNHGRRGGASRLAAKFAHATLHALARLCACLCYGPCKCVYLSMCACVSVLAFVCFCQYLWLRVCK